MQVYISAMYPSIEKQRFVLLNPKMAQHYSNPNKAVLTLSIFCSSKKKKNPERIRYESMACRQHLGASGRASTYIRHGEDGLESYSIKAVDSSYTRPAVTKLYLGEKSQQSWMEE